MSMGESVASSTMSGTEAVKTTPPAKGIEADEQTGLQGSQNQNVTWMDKISLLK